MPNNGPRHQGDSSSRRHWLAQRRAMVRGSPRPIALGSAPMPEPLFSATMGPRGARRHSSTSSATRPARRRLALVIHSQVVHGENSLSASAMSFAMSPWRLRRGTSSTSAPFLAPPSCEPDAEVVERVEADGYLHPRRSCSACPPHPCPCPHSQASRETRPCDRRSTTTVGSRCRAEKIVEPRTDIADEISAAMPLWAKASAELA